jgi:hypothetical protein
MARLEQTDHGQKGKLSAAGCWGPRFSSVTRWEKPMGQSREPRGKQKVRHHKSVYSCARGIQKPTSTIKPDHHIAPGSYPAEKPIGKQTHRRDHNRITPRNATS